MEPKDADGRLGPTADIAIVGLGGCFPDAPDVATYWQNILANHVAIGEVPATRWDPALYYSADRAAPEKTYSRIGGFVREAPFDARRFRIPPRALAAIDDVQKMALTAVADALADAGLQVFPKDATGRDFDRERTAVIIGNAMGGEAEDLTSLRVWFAEARRDLALAGATAKLPETQLAALLDAFEARYKARLPTITEDSMPGEISNCITGRVANAFDLRGPNFTCDAACAASMAALQTACAGLGQGTFDVAIVGGADRSMDPPTYVKFCKIGALSAHGSAPFDARADGFVMGEGVGVLVLMRLADAQAHGHRVYATVRGIGAASDGRGKGITAPNPRGQALAVQRAYAAAGVSPGSIGLFEAHGTSTTVGDATELQVLTDLLRSAGVAPGSVPIGSVKSMIGHLKSAAGAAALIKTALALHHRMLPPSAGFTAPAAGSPLHEGFLAVNTAARPWAAAAGPRRAGVSAFGFGGTNFHVVLEECPMATGKPVAARLPAAAATRPAVATGAAAAPPAADAAAILADLVTLVAEQTGYAAAELDPSHQLEADLGIDTVKQAEIMALVRARYALPQDATLRLADVSTLASIAAYVERLVVETEVSPPGDTSNGNQKTTASINNAPQHQADEDAGTEQSRVLLFGAQSLTALHTAVAAALTAPSLATVPQDPTARTAPLRLAFAAQDLAHARAQAAEATRRRPRLLAAQGIYLADTPPLAQRGELAFLFPGQGSQYLGMLRDLAARYPVVAATFAEADAALAPLLGSRLTDIVWPAVADEAAETRLRQTENCQPAMLTADVAMLRLLASHGVTPQRVAGHSLGEYAAAVAAGVMSFADALYAVSARGREMAGVRVEDNGKMAMVAADAARVQAVLDGVDGYIIAANQNCFTQTVVAGSSLAVDAAVRAFAAAGIEARQIPVSHAFHCKIVAPAAAPMQRVLAGLSLRAPRLPLSSNVDASYYPNDVAGIIDLLGRQLASPVQFIAQVQALYRDGARLFVEVGPRRAITGFVRNILGTKEHRALASNHPKKDGVEAFLELLAALASEGVAVGASADAAPAPRGPAAAGAVGSEGAAVSPSADAAPVPRGPAAAGAVGADAASDVHAAAVGAHAATGVHAAAVTAGPATAGAAAIRATPAAAILRAPAGARAAADRLALPVGISGVAVALPTADPLGHWQDDAIARLLGGENFIASLAAAQRQEVLDHNVVRLEKRSGHFAPLRQLSDVVALAARLGDLDLAAKYGLEPGLVEALDRTSQQAIAVGIDALRDAGLPLLRRYRTTSTGSRLPDRWALPPELARRTGVIMAAAFPGLDAVLEEAAHHAAAAGARRSVAELERFVEAQASRLQASDADAAAQLRAAFAEQAHALREEGARYAFNRKWLLRALAMGHAQLAQVILAQGPNTQVNSACASGTQAIAMARDWIRLGRCDRVVVVSCDDVTSPACLPPFAAAFMAAGAATAEPELRRAAVPFGAQRNGMILGAGAAGFVVESEAATAARGMQPICSIVAGHFGNSAFHGTRLDPAYIGELMRDAVADAATDAQQTAAALAASMVFVSHETYTPARGGSSAAEVDALRACFGAATPQVVVANTKGYTGHPMAVTFEDVVAIKGLQRQQMPAVANLADVDPAFADLKFARGGPIRARYAMRFAAGFGSQVAANVYRQVATTEARLHDPARYAAWLAAQTGDPAARLEVVHRCLRVAESGGVAATELQVPSLETMAPSAGSAATPTAARVAVEAVGKIAPASTPNAPADILAAVTALFAEHTGYEAGELHPDHHLEADLGIDTVKQAEIMAIIRERHGLPQDASFRLSDTQTLAAVVAYIERDAPAAAGAATAASVLVPAPAAVAADGPVPAPAAVAADVDRTGASATRAAVTAIFAEHTGYDVAELHPDHHLEADLGIDTVKQAEIMAIVRERYGLPQDANFRLSDMQSLAAVVAYIERGAGAGGRPAADAGNGKLASAAAAVSTVSAPAAVGAPSGSRAASAASGSSAPGASKEATIAELTAMFAEHTGYDASELAPEHQLEADLGIDTVKQAEILALIRARYALPADSPFKLSELQTIAAIAEHVSRVRGDSPEPPPEPTRQAVPATAPQPTQQAVPAAAPQPIQQAVPAAAPQPIQQAVPAAAPQAPPATVAPAFASAVASAAASATVTPGAPTPATTAAAVAEGEFAAWQVHRAPTELRADAWTLAGRTILLVGGSKAAAAAWTHALEGRGARVRACGDGATPDALAAAIADAAAPAAGAVLLQQPVPATADSVEAAVARGFALARALARHAPAASDALGGGLLVAAADAGGFGLDVTLADANAGTRGLDAALADAHAGARGQDAALADGQAGARGQDPARADAAAAATVSGTALALAGIAGVLKTLAKERPSLRCLAIDWAGAAATVGGAPPAATCLDAWQAAGACELVRAEDAWQRLRRGPIVRPAPVALPARALVVATGGARGVTFALLQALAARGPLRIVIAARTTALAPADSAIVGADDAAQKRWARAELLAAGARATPAAVRAHLQREQARLAMHANLEALRRAGCSVEMLACDVATPAALAAFATKVRAEHGTPALLLHGAGIEESRPLADKDAAAWPRTYAPKAGAALRLWQALAPQRMVTMGSVAGRFGNAGQADYAAANEVMASLARQGGGRILNLGWTAWGDIGMAVRPTVQQVLGELGVRMLPAALGARLGAHLMASAAHGDVVVAGPMGRFADDTPAACLPADTALPPVFHACVQDGADVLLSRRLDAARDGGLDHHRIDAVAVLPGVIGVEMLQQAASYVLGVDVPYLRDVRFVSPVKLHRDAPLEVQVRVSVHERGARVSLQSVFSGPGGRAQVRPHFTAEAHRVAPPSPTRPPGLEMARDAGIDRSQIYARYFHGPRFQVLHAVGALGDDGADAEAAAVVPEWLHAMAADAWRTAPVQREAGFQAAGLWEMAELSRMALPAGIDELWLAPTPLPYDAAGRIAARRRSAGREGCVFDVWACDADGTPREAMRGYRTVTLRPLADAERFEPTQPRTPTPTSLLLPIAEVARMLDGGDAEAALGKYLAPSERVAYRALKVKKRRLEWLAARVAAKRLIREACFGREAAIVPYHAITIHRDPLGAPEVEIVGEQRPPPRISMAHSDGVAAALLAPHPGLRPGIDVERVEARDASFGKTYFTAAERAFAAAAAQPNLVLTQIWAVKEAALKALGIGARVDLRTLAVRCDAAGRWHVAFTGEAASWARQIGAGDAEIELESTPTRVVARVLLPHGEPQRLARGAAKEEVQDGQ